MASKKQDKKSKPAGNSGMKTRALFTRDLPPEYLQLIGSVMVNWAFLEMRLQELVFRALGLSDQQGRLAVKSLRAKEMMNLAVELSTLRGVPFPAELDLEAINMLESRRNLLAHGVWMHHEGAYLLRDLTGTTSVNGKKVQKKVQPAGIPITLDALQNLAEQIQIAVQDTQDVIQALYKLLSSSPQTRP